jgi:PRC-barrel domain
MTRKESTMIRQILAAASVALGLAGTPAVAQQSPSPDQPMAQEADPTLVGLSVYSSDGQKVGQVSEVGTSGGQPAVRADLGEFLGMNPGSVIIGGHAFERKADRIEIAMTAQEIKDTISKQRDGPKEGDKP